LKRWLLLERRKAEGFGNCKGAASREIVREQPQEASKSSKSTSDGL
jgi:hypothetical protein